MARALTADLVTDLSKVSGLWVASGVEPNQLVQNSESARARYVLSGTIQSDGERLRLHVHLADTEAGRQLWSQRFDRHAKDLFAVQDDLVRSVLAELPVKPKHCDSLSVTRAIWKPTNTSFAGRRRYWYGVVGRTRWRATCTGRQFSRMRPLRGRMPDWR